MELFGYNIQRKKPVKTGQEYVFKDAIVNGDDINITVPNTNTKYMGAIGTTQLSLLPYNNDTDKIRLYRKMAQSNVHVALAINEIKNEVFIFDDITRKAFDIDFHPEIDLPKRTQDLIINEASALYNIINFKDNALKWFEDWYIDGWFSINVIVDEKNLSNGITNIVQLDPVRTRRVKLLPKSNPNGSININDVKEYYIYRHTYDNKNIDHTLYLHDTDVIGKDVIMSPESVIQIPSGIKNKNTDKTIGYLDKAIIPYNNLKMLEEAMMIFRIVRAPMRRAFYIDVANLQPKKADKYLEDLKNRFKVNVAFDRNTGGVTGERHLNSIMEDYYLPRQGSRTTEIQTIDGQNNQDILEEVEYARDQLWIGLNVPRSRFTEEASSIFSRPTEIQRDEHRLGMFIKRCRQQFMKFFDELLKRQLILKGIIKEQEWNKIKGNYYYNFAEDNLFVEYKNMERLQNKLDILNNMEDAINKGYFSKQYAREYVLNQNSEFIKEIKTQREEEKREE